VTVRRRALLLAGFVVLGLALRATRLALDFPLFGDEAFLATSVLERDLAGLFGHLEYDMVAPPGYLALLWASTRAFGAEEWVLRLPSFLAGCVALLIVARFAWRRLGTGPALFAVASLSAGYYVARHTCEAKPYALDLLAGALLVAAFTPGVAGRAEPGRPARLALACAVVWFSYPAAFVAGGALLARALLRDGRTGSRAGRTGRARLGELAVDGLCLLLSFGAMYLLHGRDQQWGPSDLAGHARQWTDDFPPLSAPAELLPWLVRQHTGYMLALPVGGSGLGSVGSLALVVLGLVAARRGPWPFLRRLLLLSLALQMLAACLELYPYGGSARTSLHVFPLFALFLGAGLQRAMLLFGTRARARRGRTVALSLLAVLVVVIGARDVRKPYKHAPDLAFREIVRELATEVSHGATVALLGHVGHVGDVGAAPAGPDVRIWRSLSARARCYVRIETGRAPTTTVALEVDGDPDWSGETWVLAFADTDIAPFPTAELDAFTAALLARGGSAERRDHDLGRGQTLAVLRCSGPSGDTLPAGGD
jgi:hypothetical protein